ncbi:WD repeat-containing protein 89 [Borealophlyctis nickersoniae]|nr:WD repeat-containing protein 89 [Borealophlyctis nickersoniae]
MAVAPYSPFRLVHQRPPHGNEGWILDVVPSRDSTVFATPTAGGLVRAYDLATLSVLGEINATNGSAEATLSEVAFDSTNNALLWTGDKGGKVALWDLRTATQVRSYAVGAPVLSFSVNSAHTTLAAGTELVGDDAFIRFWDLRGDTRMQAQFAECHSDDVTQSTVNSLLALDVTDKTEAMISGSTDGLVCLYNLETFEEEDALYQVIKDDSVHKIGFFGPSFEYLYCLTHVETFSLWRFFEGEKIYQFGDIRMSQPEITVDYLIDCTYDPAGQRMYLLTGSQTGNMGILHVNLGKLDLVHTLNGGHTDIVRGVFWEPQRGILVSGGEDGVVSAWANH